MRDGSGSSDGGTGGLSGVRWSWFIRGRLFFCSSWVSYGISVIVSIVTSLGDLGSNVGGIGDVPTGRVFSFICGAGGDSCSWLSGCISVVSVNSMGVVL